MLNLYKLLLLIGFVRDTLYGHVDSENIFDVEFCSLMPTN